MRPTSTPTFSRRSAFSSNGFAPNCEFNTARKWKSAKCKYLIATMPLLGKGWSSYRKLAVCRHHLRSANALSSRLWARLACCIRKRKFRPSRTTGKIPRSINSSQWHHFRLFGIVHSTDRNSRCVRESVKRSERSFSICIQSYIALIER